MTTSARPEGPPAPAHPGVGRHAFLVASGIFLSRIAGLVRDRIFAHYFGITYVADAFKAALRIPNTLQNLFGEGVLSASFIPVYAKLIAQKDREEAGRVAGAVFSLLAVITSVLVLVGVLATPYIIDVIAFGFKGETRRLAIQLVRILFPGVGLLVMSAWCLGILNSHGKFFLSYVSPVLWNAAFIAAMLAFRGSDMSHLAVYTAWGSVVGSGLQFLVQLPMVLRLAPELRIFFTALTENVRVVIRNFVPVFFSRGVLQLSAYIDGLLASLLPVGGVSALANAQTLYTLPVSLFGMSISAAELPAMSSTLGTHEQVATTLRQRIAASTRRVGFFVVPSAVGFIALGDVITATIYQTRKVFSRRRGKGLDDSGRLWRRPSGIDGRPTLFFCLLRIARYANACPLCHCSRDTHDGVGIFLFPTLAAAFGRGSVLGRSRADSIGRICGVGGVCIVATRDEPEDRTQRVPCSLLCSIVGCCGDCRSRGVGSKAGLASTKAVYRRLC